MNKWKIEECKTRRNVIPEVGQFWKHTGDCTVYLRVSDGVGISALPYMAGKNSFFSVNEEGAMVHTDKDCKNIELLCVKFSYE